MIYLMLFFSFFKVGLFCFGGAFGMIPLIEETVLQHGWPTSNSRATVSTTERGNSL